MVRPARPEVRRQLIERAAGMLARREKISLRSLVAGLGVSTMAVYTYFDGMSGLLGAVRQEGFTRLADRLAELSPTDDAVSDLAAAGAAYLESAKGSPDLYALMFDGSLPLPDRRAADATLAYLVGAAQRAIESQRFERTTDARSLANELWLFGHGACMLLVTGVLSFERIEPIVTTGLVHLYRAAGDEPEMAERSMLNGWSRGASR
ncbi:TetR/AcrR family transcriptional regulator [Ruania halotolerans]|uniref:TetR/AcrR family transcriptional regulator n=1 Tax=Ruania halotolerans TaxID=2897773 RepID=UPI001E5AAF7A|nr:TetR/AcrR family transcriptional regulator [Ruania halotolerans]UFU07098.1 TetR/AcrR family transcriptional regulator [Ruania halotolerans]